MNRLFGMWALGCGLSVAVATAACAKAQAKSAPEGPPLVMPTPPPRVIVAMEEAPAPPPVVEDTPVPTAPAPRPVPPPTPPRTATRPEPKGDAAPPVAATPETKPAESRTLRAPGETAESERAIRERLSAASRDLARVDYAKLSSARRTQYEQSKRFVQQAEQAIKEQNLVFAATLADKAAALAAELVK